MMEDVEAVSRSMRLLRVGRCSVPETYEPIRICDLPDDLLVRILLCVPTKTAVTTTVLSKRWRFVWTMLPELVFEDEEYSESVPLFVEKSLQLHKAPILRRLVVKLGPHLTSAVDIGNWVEKAVNRGVEELDFKLLLYPDPISLPKSLYTCNTLVYLTLSKDILVDVFFSAYLPSLVYLDLICVMYKDEDSLARLLSSSPVLKRLRVERRQFYDNLKTFTVKVSSLEILSYKDKLDDDDDDDVIGSLVIDSPALKELYVSEDYILIQNMPCLNMAYIADIYNTDNNFLRSLSSVIHLNLYLNEPMVALCNTTTFSRLIELNISSDHIVDWLEPLMFLLENSPKLKFLTIEDMELPSPQSSWNQPSYVPGCLLSHLEILRWNNYGGREDEKQFVAYILANSNCLKTVEISFIATCNLEETQKELESMLKISKPQILFPTEIDLWFYGKLLS